MSANRNVIRHTYISDSEYDMMCVLLEQLYKGVADEDGNVLAVIKLENKQFGSLLSFCKKIVK